eukprot:TRINITY_DN1717_c0_g1_i1.p1 TRINITY_DN1717_c0_g1~~TRINITY_DN1717_c0_g1_i1.p1  ORF type:complete len:464 (+),score=158.80 TRINITY_DN1717_c0_g1_i1:63-1394(+)
MPSKQRNRKFGELAAFSDKLLHRLLKYLTKHDITALAGTCWMGYELQNDEEFWKERCLNDSAKGEKGLLEGKEARFLFKMNWKYTYCRPGEVEGEVPVPISTVHMDHYKFSVSKKARWYAKNIDVSSIPLKGLRVPEVPAESISVEQFFERYDKANTPVVVTNVVKAWGWNGWTQKDLLSRHGKTVFKTNGTTVDGKTLRMTFRQYTEYCKYAWGRGEKPLYIFDNKFEERAKDLTQDYSIPPYFRNDLFDCMSQKDRPDYKWLLIGPEGSGAPFHTDPHQTHAWNVVTEGRKRIAFYPPRTIPPGVDRKLIHTEYYAASDTMDWYLNYYPNLTRAELPLETIVEAGDMIFIPSGWWHQVLNVAPFTIAITQNVCSPGNFPRVWRDLQKRGPKSLARRFKRDCLPTYGALFDTYEEPQDVSSEEDQASSSSSSSSSDSSSFST